MNNSLMKVLALGLCTFAAGATAQTQTSSDDFADLFGPDASAASDTPAATDAASASTEDQSDAAGDEPVAGESAPDADSPVAETAETYDVVKVSDSSSDAAEDTIAGPRRSRLVEEIVVTAQKREENLQDVPITINAFSGDKLDAFGVESTADLQKITPGLTYTYAYGYSVIFIRGVGTDAFLPNADPSVATYIDGINIGPSQGKQDTLGPVKRVEVLKGPQGTLFGRNSTAGAINIVTEDPPDEFSGSLKAEFGNYHSRKYQIYLGTPITDYAGATLSLFQENQDLFGHNEVFGERGPEREDYVKGGRLRFKLHPTDNLSLDLVGSLNKQFNSNSLSQENTRPAPLLLAGTPPDELDRVWHNDYQGGNETTNVLYGATLEWLTSVADIKFIFSDNKADVDEAMYDFDSTESSEATFYSNDQYNYQRTYELQFVSNDTSPLAGTLQWTAGLYRLEGEGGFGSLYLTVNALGLVSNLTGLPNLLNRVGNLLSLNGLGYTVNQLINATNDVVLGNGGILTTESNSAYLQTTWFALPWLDITLGARYQMETRGITNSYLDVVLPTAGEPPNDYFDRHDTSQNIRVRNFSAPDLEDNTLSPRLAIQIKPSDEFQIYASAQRAFKSPTYNIVNFFSNPDPVERETDTAFEVGIKSDWLDGALRLNAAAFHTQIDGLLTAIVSVTSGGIVSFRNAGEAVINGAEFDALWQPMPSMNPGLAIATSATFLDGKYTDYKNGSGFDDTTGLYFGADSVLGLPARDFTGNDIVRTPDFTGNISINQLIDVGSVGSFELGVDYYYNSGFNTTPQNSPYYEQAAYDLLGGRVSYFYEPFGLQLTAFVDNALNEDYAQAIVQHDFGRTVTLAPPRLYGLRVKLEF
jgi:iron complex outermembrane receptor protein